MNKINELKLRDFQDLFMETYRKVTGLTKLQDNEKFMATKCMVGNFWQYWSDKISYEELKKAAKRYYEVCGITDAAYFDHVKSIMLKEIRADVSILDFSKLLYFYSK